MPDDPQPGPPVSGFPYATAFATLVTLFLFLGLVMVAYRSPNYLGDVVTEPPTDPAAKLQDVQTRNQALLDGTDPTAKMSVSRATAEVLAHTQKTKGETSKYGRLPFPVAPQAPPPSGKE